MNYLDAIADIVKSSKDIHENYSANISFEEILDLYCRSTIRSHFSQLWRNGYNGLTPSKELISEQIVDSEQIVESLFYSCVARDILEGDIFRPLIGNIRKVALDHYKSLTDN